LTSTTSSACAHGEPSAKPQRPRFPTESSSATMRHPDLATDLMIKATLIRGRPCPPRTPQAMHPGAQPCLPCAGYCYFMITVRKITRSLAAVLPGWLVVVCGVCLVIPPAGWRHCCSPPGCAWFSPGESAARRARGRAASRTALAVRCLACASVQPATAVTRERGCPRPLRSRREGIVTRSDARRRPPGAGVGWLGQPREDTRDLRVQPHSGK